MKLHEPLWIKKFVELKKENERGNIKSYTYIGY